MFSHTFDKSNFWDDTCSFFDDWDFKQNPCTYTQQILTVSMGMSDQNMLFFSSFTILAVQFFAIYLFSISVLGWFSLSKFCVDQKLIRTKGCPNSSRLILITYCFRFFICHEPSSSFQWSLKAVSFFFLLFVSHIRRCKWDQFSINTYSLAWACSLAIHIGTSIINFNTKIMHNMDGIFSLLLCKTSQ